MADKICQILHGLYSEDIKQLSKIKYYLSLNGLLLTRISHYQMKHFLLRKLKLTVKEIV